MIQREMLILFTTTLKKIKEQIKVLNISHEQHKLLFVEDMSVAFGDRYVKDGMIYVAQLLWNCKKIATIIMEDICSTKIKLRVIVGVHRTRYHSIFGICKIFTCRTFWIIPRIRRQVITTHSPIHISIHWTFRWTYNYNSLISFPVLYYYYYFLLLCLYHTSITTILFLHSSNASFVFYNDKKNFIPIQKN